MKHIILFLLIFTTLDQGVTQVLRLENCNGRIDKLKVGGEVDLYYLKDVQCEKCANCNYIRAQGKIKEFTEDNKIVIEPIEVEDRSLDTHGLTTSIITKVHNPQGGETLTYDLASLDKLRYTSFTRKNLQNGAFTIIGISVFYQMLLVPPLFAIDGNKEKAYDRFWKLTLPSLVSIGVAIPISIAASPSKKYELQPSVNNPSTDCLWKVK